MAKKPQSLPFGIPPPQAPKPRVLTQAEIDDRRRRSSLGMLTSPMAEMMAEAIVDVSDGGEVVVLETNTHRLEVTVTPK